MRRASAIGSGDWWKEVNTTLAQARSRRIRRTSDRTWPGSEFARLSIYPRRATP